MINNLNSFKSLKHSINYPSHWRTCWSNSHTSFQGFPAMFIILDVISPHVQQSIAFVSFNIPQHITLTVTVTLWCRDRGQTRSTDVALAVLLRVNRKLHETSRQTDLQKRSWGAD